MAYNPGYDNYDPYSRPMSRSMSRSMSRRQSIGYPGTPYPQSHSMYDGGSPGSDYQQPYQGYGHSSSAVVPMSRRLTGAGKCSNPLLLQVLQPNQCPEGYDNYDSYEEPYYDGQMAMQAMSHVPSTSMIMPRVRRHSTVSFAGRPPAMDTYRFPSGTHIKFKRKGSFTAGIGLDEAQQRIKLSNNDSYSYHDLHADSRRRVYLRIKWTGYSSLTYEIPLDGYDGRVDLQTLARRVSRACVHYLQANVIPVVWDRVVLHHLEEVSYGVWQPMLSMR